MDPAKQHEISSMGGQASGGIFEAGSEKAREAGHRGGEASGGKFEPGSERAGEAGHKGVMMRRRTDWFLFDGVDYLGRLRL
ncbi:hypothetical protein EMPG_11363 [Blastomyces silverae]|uniref:Conidiation-specific protein 10 n=1 Tax=Blastomyces silverae TaxID=2060906 RepID=A0A0H1BRI6_9EURO|nr:hypothetical protein EMPG_11363 [Blastomyces silverae]